MDSAVSSFDISSGGQRTRSAKHMQHLLFASVMVYDAGILIALVTLDYATASLSLGS